jgi:MoxR-like ATPase
VPATVLVVERLSVVSAAPHADDELARATALARALVDALAASVRAPRPALASAVACLLAGGHLLIEDVPGVGKTVLAKSLARAAGCAFARLQCTADLLPSDVTGVHVYDQRTQTFDFRPGPVFANFLLADEINRASPKTQSALLESMEEAQVTVDGHTRPLPRPFMVVATMNPIEYEGTFPLPEAQLDRFALRLSIGYPPAEQEARMIVELASHDPVDDVSPVADDAAIRAAIAAAGAVHVDPAIATYVVDLVTATRQDRRLVLGGSPRAALTLLRVAKAVALIEGQPYVVPEHVKSVATAVLGHRLVLGPEARVAGLDGDGVVADALAAVRAPAL